MTKMDMIWIAVATGSLQYIAQLLMSHEHEMGTWAEILH